MRTIKYLLIACIFLNITLVFCNIFSPTWAVQQINLWLEAPVPTDRLISQEAQKNTVPITINGEVKAIIEVERSK